LHLFSIAGAEPITKFLTVPRPEKVYKKCMKLFFVLSAHEKKTLFVFIAFHWWAPKTTSKKNPRTKGLKSGYNSI
jgi:hypothetical protein